MSNKMIGNLSLLTIGFLFGLSAVIAKYLSEFMSAYQVVGWRCLIAFLFLLPLLMLFRQGLVLKKENSTQIFWFVTSFAISVILFTLAIFYASVSVAVFSFYAATLVFSFIVGYLSFGEKVNTYKWIAIALVTLAMMLLTRPFEGFVLELGLLFGIGAGFLQAVTSKYQKILGESSDKISLLFVQTLGGAIAGFGGVVLLGQSFVPNLDVFGTLVLAAFGFFFLLISYLFLVGFKYANLNTGSVLVSTELLFAPLMAFILLSEELDAYIFSGGVLMILAVLFVYLSDSKEV
jgi:drug/metabolite transporter (DMT)-like permease